MNPSTGQGITNFSPCSVGNICSAIGRNSVKTSCLSNNKGVPLMTAAVCGNGIVEDGEDCDCGGTSGCGNDACCNAATCKFKAGAVCDDANEECCKNCQFSAANTVCRKSTGVCDPQEVCTGTNATCPPDVTAPDGQNCGNNQQCASGQCTSRNLQCQQLMGSYLKGNNDTYACDSAGCQLSCASPEFGTGVCYGLQQNFLDGTPCGGGGKCNNVSTSITALSLSVLLISPRVSAKGPTLERRSSLG
jgi:disintegrin